ncbi:MAG: hypothetical protein HZC39_13165 [Chloroflexi bacterium]|nr:hypothetical protein [Chloroflexota bacterium]MBI5704476.1 hypothetical protein [Chloroflexota bacterium]GER78832.1 conserved hypothetical protein [Candidatus Denitrolinea symbiosum]
MEKTREPMDKILSAKRRIRQVGAFFVVVTVAFLFGVGSGYLKWGQDETAESTQQEELIMLYEQVNPKDGYTLPVSYGDIGPQLLESGVIDYDAFAAIYENSSTPLSEAQIKALTQGSDEPIVINAENAHFLLNYFWAVGLVNKNPILTEGPIVQNSGGQIERFASTGGWTLAAKPITELYASVDLIPLTAEQQKRVEEVAAAVYRPCCNNPTLFPDCNHGMAMLGLLELMASQGASTDDMFEAAKYVNAFWFPQQNLETALYLKSTQDMDFEDADARLVTGVRFSSGSGFAAVHQQLQASGLLPQAPGQGGSCAN